MDDVETQITEWRAYVAKAPAVEGRDVEELEAHLRDQIAELDAAGLSADEAFLVAVKRMGDLDTLSRELAREHSGRLWKQLMLRGEDEPARAATGWTEAVMFAFAAAVTIQVARLAAGFPDEEPMWLARNVGLFVLPFLTAYFARRRQLDGRGWMHVGVAPALAALVVNVYPYGADRRSHRSRCRRSGDPMGAALRRRRSGDRRGMARRVETTGDREHGAGADDGLTPLFALMLPIAAVTYAAFGLAGDFDRELLGVFDALLVVVLGLVLYSMSARDPDRPAGLMDRVELLAVNLAGAARHAIRFHAGRTTFHRLERWQTSYLPVFAVWAAAVVVALPPIFAFD